jgi:hypothetical protein
MMKTDVEETNAAAMTAAEIMRRLEDRLRDEPAKTIRALMKIIDGEAQADDRDEPDSELQPVAWYLDKEGNRRPIYRRDGGVSTTGV